MCLKKAPFQHSFPNTACFCVNHVCVWYQQISSTGHCDFMWSNRWIVPYRAIVQLQTVSYLSLILNLAAIPCTNFQRHHLLLSGSGWQNKRYSHSSKISNDTQRRAERASPSRKIKKILGHFKRAIEEVRSLMGAEICQASQNGRSNLKATERNEQTILSQNDIGRWKRADVSVGVLGRTKLRCLFVISST